MSFGPGRYRRGMPPSGVRGLYRYVDKSTGAVDYVGRSDDLRRRYQQHLRGSEPVLDESVHHFDWKEQT